MPFNKKLSEIPSENREKYLLLKYRELRLIHKFDRITDRYTSLKKLMGKSLQEIRKVFSCGMAVFLIGNGSNRPDKGFFIETREKFSDDAIALVQKLVRKFLSEPQVCEMVRKPSPEALKLGIKNFVMFPMVITTEIAGVFLLADFPEKFGDKEIHWLKVISSQLDNAVIHALFQETHRETQANLKQRARELNTLYEMSLSLGLGYDFHTLAEKVLESAMELVRVDRGSVMLLNKSGTELNTEVVCGEKQKIRLVKLEPGKGIAGMAFITGKPILAARGSDDPRFVPFEFSGIKPKRIFSLLSIPLVSGERSLGVLNFSMLSKKRNFVQGDIDTLSVAANLIGLAFQRQQFYQMSIKDELTGLYSFRYFKERLREEVTRSKRYRMRGALVLFDLDHFKSINDTFGHPFGNVVLKAVAEIMKTTVRQDVDLPARFGGEEMALILPHTEMEGAQILAERIRKKVEEVFLEHEGMEVKVTISGGVAAFNETSEDVESVLEQADRALYRAKEGGRNRIEPPLKPPARN